MARRLAQRVVHLMNVPLRLNLPSQRENITEFSLRTVPNATKIEIKRILQSVYGLKVSKVNTMNYDGKRKRRGGGWMATTPPYKKAYVVLREPVSLPGNLFPFNLLDKLNQESEEEKAKEAEKRKELRPRRNSSNANTVARRR
ncbi:hypothetical protein L7F22_062953 [Adiantum nelumboides]|nr:hypothetical protein [Adiantum nelumboides]